MEGSKPETGFGSTRDFLKRRLCDPSFMESELDLGRERVSNAGRSI